MSKRNDVAHIDTLALAFQPYAATIRVIDRTLDISGTIFGGSIHFHAGCAARPKSEALDGHVIRLDITFTEPPIKMTRYGEVQSGKIVNYDGRWLLPPCTEAARSLVADVVGAIKAYAALPRCIFDEPDGPLRASRPNGATSERESP